MNPNKYIYIYKGDGGCPWTWKLYLRSFLWYTLYNVSGFRKRFFFHLTVTTFSLVETHYPSIKSMRDDRVQCGYDTCTFTERNIFSYIV